MMEPATQSAVDNVAYLGCSDEVEQGGVAAVVEAVGRAEIVPPPPPAAPPSDVGGQGKEPPSIVPLGHVGGVYYFISKDGEQRHFSARELVRLNIASLVGGDTTSLANSFPCYNKKGEVVIGAFNANLAAEWLMRECSRVGLFNPETPQRRLGVWRSGDQIIAHLGAYVWIKAEKLPAGRMIEGAIYPACNRVKEPDFSNPADKFDAMRLRLNLNAWAFTQTHDADLLFGYLGAALLGGYPAWRAHALVTGVQGKAEECAFFYETGHYSYPSGDSGGESRQPEQIQSDR